jgi:hypothetical protein
MLSTSKDLELLQRVFPRGFQQLVSPQCVVVADEKNLMKFSLGRSGERTSVPADAWLPEARPHWGCGQGAPHLH